MHAEMPGVPECELRMDARVTKCENNTVEDMKRRRLKKGGRQGGTETLYPHIDTDGLYTRGAAGIPKGELHTC